MAVPFSTGEIAQVIDVFLRENFRTALAERRYPNLTLKQFLRAIIQEFMFPNVPINFLARVHFVAMATAALHHQRRSAPIFR